MSALHVFTYMLAEYAGSHEASANEHDSTECSAELARSPAITVRLSTPSRGRLRHARSLVPPLYGNSRPGRKEPSLARLANLILVDTASSSPLLWHDLTTRDRTHLVHYHHLSRSTLNGLETIVNTSPRSKALHLKLASDCAI